MRSFRFLSVLALSWVCLEIAARAATNRFELEVRVLEAADAKSDSLRHAVMLYGSSSFRLWKDVESRFPNHPVVNRGFGGSQLSDLNFFFDRLVVPAAPKVLLIYGGDNDIAAKKSPQQVLDDFRELVARAKRKLPGIRIAFLAIKPSPSRAGLLSAQSEANRQVEKFAKSVRRVDYLDVATPLLDAQGNPDPACFIQDRLHLNALGYDRWVKVLGPYLERHAPWKRS